ncbi:hypothetical protein [Zavarzinia compransoris]|uniref:DUF3613 domain-containing protein n=1 Tax=Zavarzinia compransoris TaxID=1264899 RepID=A0A317DSU9_9PROT|nr:hypothetical protein [Zavarzinia compransoris]PWR17767.1 hypothetical protein DKG75_21725 [Zavarzinia compransoris]TDP49295.1 hypothetical protein DES42_101666 [Zavarzinia compransoris]
MKKIAVARPLALALALAGGILPVALAPLPSQAQSGPTELGTGASPTLPALPPFARTRSVLQAQHAAPGGRTVTSGAEAGKVYENYLGSVGKGGAGASAVKLSAGGTSSSSSGN